MFNTLGQDASAVGRETQEATNKSAQIVAKLIIAAIAGELKKNKDLQNRLQLDTKSPPKVEVDVNGKKVFAGVEGEKPQINTPLSQAETEQLERLGNSLNAGVGEKVEGIENASIKINGELVYQIKGGEVTHNGLSSELRQNIQISTQAEPNTPSFPSQPLPIHPDFQGVQATPEQRQQDLKNLQGVFYAKSLLANAETDRIQAGSYEFENTQNGTQVAYQGQKIASQARSGEVEGSVSDQQLHSLERASTAMKQYPGQSEQKQTVQVEVG